MKTGRTILALMLAPQLALAAGIQSGVVLDLRISSRNGSPGNPSHVRLDQATILSPFAPCGVNPYNYWAFDTDTTAGKNMLAALLMAEATGRQVTIYGNGLCDLRSDMETVYQVAVAR